MGYIKKCNMSEQNILLDSYGQETVDTILEREITLFEELAQKSNRIKELESRPMDN